MFLEKENFKLSRKCTKDEHECRNTYGSKICVPEKLKYVACAKYSIKTCDDDKFLTEYQTSYQ